MKIPNLSVIIPCKNEAKNIGRCLTCLIKGLKHIDNTHILVVDSASTDKTVQIAQDFPVDIIQLKDGWIHSPAAAKYLGCLNTRSKYIFTLDADMELLPEFMSKALDFMEAQERVAGVAGMGCEVYEEGGKLDDLYKRKNALQEVNFLGGAALYTRYALEQAGYFNPYLRSEEEAELAQRLKAKGFKLFSLPYPMIIHHTCRDIQGFLNRLNNGFFLGIGQMLRISFLRKCLIFSLLRFKLFIYFIASLFFLTGLNIYAIVTNNLSLFIYEAIAIFALWLTNCIIKRGFSPGSLSIIKWILINLSIIKGLFQKIGNPRNYPRAVTVIKRSKN